MNNNTSLFLILFVIFFVSCGTKSDSDKEEFSENQSPIYTVYGKSTNPELKEISGMVRTPAFDQCFWIHNDSGDSPRIFRVDLDLHILQEVKFQEMTHVDWEDIAYGSYKDQETLFIGDIGDNKAIREQIQIYMVREPEEGIALGQAFRSIELTYPDGPRDAEALLFDEKHNEIVILTKRDEKSRVYTYKLDATDLGVLTFEGELQLEGISQLGSKKTHRVTAADAINGHGIIIKNYDEVYFYPLTEAKRYAHVLTHKTPQKLEYTPELQGEAISLDGDGYWVTSECADDGATHQPQPLYFYPFDVESQIP